MVKPIQEMKVYKHNLPGITWYFHCKVSCTIAFNPNVTKLVQLHNSIEIIIKVTSFLMYETNPLQLIVSSAYSFASIVMALYGCAWMTFLDKA